MSQTQPTTPFGRRPWSRGGSSGAPTGRRAPGLRYRGGPSLRSGCGRSATFLLPDDRHSHVPDPTDDALRAAAVVARHDGGAGGGSAPGVRAVSGWKLRSADRTASARSPIPRRAFASVRLSQTQPTTPFGRRPLSLAMMAAQAAAKACPDEAARPWARTDNSRLEGNTTRSAPGVRAVSGWKLRSADRTASVVEAGLVIRRDSPNGKRYARRGEGGRIEQAFGFDTPPGRRPGSGRSRGGSSGAPTGRRAPGLRYRGGTTGTAMSQTQPTTPFGRRPLSLAMMAAQAAAKADRTASARSPIPRRAFASVRLRKVRHLWLAASSGHACVAPIRRTLFCCLTTGTAMSQTQPTTPFGRRPLSLAMISLRLPGTKRRASGASLRGPFSFAGSILSGFA
jgi:hypothetical protein